MARTNGSAPVSVLPLAPAQRVRLWVLGFALWTVMAFLSASQNALFMWSIGETPRWASTLPRSLADWYSCAIFTPVYFWMVRRWPLYRRGIPGTLAIYAAFTAVMVVAKYTIYLPFYNALRPGEPASTLEQLLARSFVTENIAFWCLLAVVLGVEYYRDLREREVHAARLEAQLAHAKLDNLAAQLHPHFLFNTIQGISTLIHRDPEAADVMLARLSDLLRSSLQRDGDGHEITLEKEMELLRLYLGVVQERFADRLTLTIRVPEALNEALVPHFLLQPLVENALHHGIARRAGAGHIEISAAQEEGALVLRVKDDGPGLAGTRPFPTRGIGLANTRERLRQLYGDAQTLQVGPGENGGFEVRVQLPLRSLPVEA